jgi:Coenzyme PQQ synthesis protein D (PqqD)
MSTGTMTGILLRRASSLPFQKLEHEILVVDPRTRAVHLLNPTATRVWELLEFAATREHLLATLADEFDAPSETIGAHLGALLADLEAKGLVGPAPEHERATTP